MRGRPAKLGQAGRAIGVCRSCERLSRAARGSSSSTPSSTRFSRAATTFLAIDNLASGRRELVDAGARFEEVDIRNGDVLRTVFAGFGPTCPSTSPRRQMCACPWSGRTTTRTSISSTIRVLEAALSVEAQVVFASTGGAIYGECERPATEDDPRAPASPYGTSKLAAEEYLATWNRLYGSEHVALATGTCSGRDRIRTARPALWRSNPGGSPRAGR